MYTGTRTCLRCHTPWDVYRSLRICRECALELRVLARHDQEDAAMERKR